MDKFEFDKALNEAFTFIDACNTFVQDKKPWESKDKKVLYEISNAIKDVTILLSPFMPASCKKISQTFNFELSLKALKTPLQVNKIKKSEILFTKIEATPKIANTNLNKSPKIEGIMTPIDFKDWQKIELKVARIENVEDIEGADKLYKLTVNLGTEKRTICAGLKKFYTPSQLKGKKCIIFVNLAPKIMKGIKSQGMLLAAESPDRSQVTLIQPEKDIKEGSKVM